MVVVVKVGEGSAQKQQSQQAWASGRSEQGLGRLRL